jgi:aminopeptidase N
VAGIQAVGFDGGMELASAIFYGQYSLSGRGTPALVAHEMAHQWFGDSVTESDWDDIWLSEGFATFFAHVYAEKYEGRQAYIEGLKRSRPVVFAAERREPKLAIIHDNLSDTRRILNSLVYQKGAWVLHMLREELGEEAFWSGIRAYYSRYRDRNATTADFRKVMEETSKRDLAWFFQQWLNQPASPRIEANWIYNAGTKTVKLKLAQTQAGDPYRLQLEARLGEPGPQGASLHTIDLKERKLSIELPAPSEPSTITLDPSSKLLFEAKVTKN